MIPRPVRLAAFALFFVSPLLAQRGDRAGEVQAPPPPHIVIPPAPVLTADQALQTFTVAKGFHVELVAADPLVGIPSRCRSRRMESSGSSRCAAT